MRSGRNKIIAIVKTRSALIQLKTIWRDFYEQLKFGEKTVIDLKEEKQKIKEELVGVWKMHLHC